MLSQTVDLILSSLLQPRGYGFVHFGNETDANKAQENMHGKQLAGKNIVARIRNQGKSRWKHTMFQICIMIDDWSHYFSLS